jgi:CheY-like chemotaxis protein
MTKDKWILLAEDNANDADLTMRALSSDQSACEVVLAGDGAAAMDCLFRRGAFRSRQRGPPAVVLLDLKMPKVDGLEVLRQIKNDAALRIIPTVVFTSSRERKDIVRAFQLGANAYVVKPLDFREYVSVLKDLKKFWLVTNEAPSADLMTAAAAQPIKSQPQLAIATQEN